MEEFLIQPTAWYYMKSLGESNSFLGITLAAYSAGTLIFSPFVGALETKFPDSTKMIFLLCGFVKLFGNLLYSIPVNGYFPLCGRFISGMAEGAVGLLFGAVSKCTTETNRAKAFLYFEGLYNAGAIFGPVVGSVLTFNVNICGWRINAGNSPGVLFVILWCFLLTVTILLPRDVTGNSETREEIPDEETNGEEDSLNSSADEKNGTSLSVVICIYFLLFLIQSIAQVVSFYVPLLAQHHFGLGVNHIKFLYVTNSLFIFVIFISTSLFIHKIPEKVFAIFGILLIIVPISITFYFATVWNYALSFNKTYLLLIGLISSSIQYVNYPIVCTLLSKVTPAKDASFYQSLTFTAAHLGIIASRLIGGATFAKTPMMYTCLGLAICWLLGLVWFSIEYKNFDREDEKEK